MVETYDSTLKKQSYMSKIIDENTCHLHDTTNGISDGNQLVYLQVRGQNQLLKEIQQTQGIERKLIDQAAIHRNEITKEQEGCT